MKRILTALIAAAVMVASIQMSVFADDTVPADNEQVTAAEFQQEENPETPEQGTGIAGQGKDDGLPDKDDLSHDEFQPEKDNKENTTEGENLKQNGEETIENDDQAPEENKPAGEEKLIDEFQTIASNQSPTGSITIKSSGAQDSRGRGYVEPNKTLAVDESGISIPSDSRIYTWYKDDEPIEGVDSASYIPTEGDIGSKIRLEITSETSDALWKSNVVVVEKYYVIPVTRENVSGAWTRRGDFVNTGNQSFQACGWTGETIWMRVWTGQHKFKGWYMGDKLITDDFKIEIILGQENYGVDVIDQLSAIGEGEGIFTYSSNGAYIHVGEGYQTAESDLRITNKLSEIMNFKVTVDRDDNSIFSISPSELTIEPGKTGRIEIHAELGQENGEYSCIVVLEDEENRILVPYPFTLSVKDEHKADIRFSFFENNEISSVYTGKDQTVTAILDAAKDRRIVVYKRPVDGDREEIELTEKDFDIKTGSSASKDGAGYYVIKGESVPVCDVGTYKIFVTVKQNHPDYYGSVCTLFHTITPAPVSIKFGETQFTYDGTPKAVTATYIDVNGEEKPAEVTYNGETAVPSASGTYTVKASIPDKNYMVDGTETATLKISSTAQEPVTPSTPDDKPSNPSISTTDDDNDDDSSSSSSSASVNTPVYGDGTTTSGRTINVTSSAISSVVGKAASSGTTARIYIADTAAISKSVLNGMKAPVTFTASNYAVTFDPAKMNERVDVKFSIKTSAPSAQNTFEKYFKEPVATVSCAQKGSFGGTVYIDIKPDKLGNINTSKTMYVYSWNAAANSYKKVGYAVLLKNGRIRCYTDRGYDLVISNASSFTLK